MEEKKVETKREIKSVYEKLQKCRAILGDKKIAKSGKNSYSKYEYFELKDFLPIVNKLFEENKLTSIFNLNKEEATLKIINIENISDEVVFSVPVAEAQISGCSPIQALGGQITYLRRYLYINALEIAESDMQNREKPVEKNVAEEELKVIYMSKVDSLIAETGTDYEDLNKHFKVTSSKDLNLAQLKEAVKILELKKSKQKEEVF